MAIENGVLDLAFTAGEDLSSFQYHFVHLADNNSVDLMDGATEFPIGVLQNAPESGETAVVRVMGVSKVVANDALAVGALVKAEYVGAADTGKADAADTDGDIARGVVVFAAGAENDVCSVLLITSKISVPA
ncbi:MAG: DUF2190 family protein [Deltaproteobacteria bacterium]|nr:DUF2190 family protein [Deltaproteobacteria bacterium]